ncbi:MAG: PadR family transcriptional regulator [Microbacterium sp.]
MSVRQSLLAILAQGPCYGYQLRHEFDRRTGSVRPLNVGQVYNTLERLERDGLVARGEPDEHGHVYWEITDAGRISVADWLSAPLKRTTPTRDDLAIKLAIIATLPGADASAVLAAQRSASLRQWESLQSSAMDDEAATTPEELARALLVDSLIFAAEAEVRWLDHVARRLEHLPAHNRAMQLATEKPRRGRPAGSAPTGSAPSRPIGSTDIVTGG